MNVPERLLSRVFAAILVLALAVWFVTQAVPWLSLALSV
jgi:hypothetical protein